MSTLVLELPSNLLERLKIEAEQRRQPVEEIAAALISNGLMPAAAPDSERQQVRQMLRDERKQVDRVLRDSGMLVYLTEGMRARIDPDIDREEVLAALGNAGGQTLSEIVLEQRGSKE